MAIVSMNLVNIVIHKEVSDPALKDIIEMENLHLVDAKAGIKASDFMMAVNTKHIDEILGLSKADDVEASYDFKVIEGPLDQMMNYVGVSKEVMPNSIESVSSYQEIKEISENLFKDLSRLLQKKEDVEKKLKTLENLEVLEYITEPGINFLELDQLTYFEYSFGLIPKEQMARVIKNYENIFAMILPIGTYKNKEICLVLSMHELALETQRILRSVYYESIHIPKDLLGTRLEMIENIKDEKEKCLKVLSEIEASFGALKTDYEKPLQAVYQQLILLKCIQEIKSYAAVSSDYLYLTGWVPEDETNDFMDRLSKYESDVSVGLRTSSEVAMKPPTLMKNKVLYKPFETLVDMYGTPNYSELDPTPFVAWAYMFLFGAMFGDLGQGLFLLIVGFLLSKKNVYGRILKRIGFSSMIFGFFYDSLFGYEHVISSIFPSNLENQLFFRPIENINTMLILAVISGLVFIYISYIYSVINKVKKKDIEEGIFGRNGLVGLALFSSVLLLIAHSFLDWTFLPGNFLKVFVFLMIVLMFLKEPLSRKLGKKETLYHESASSYYVESSFELFETFLGMISSGISFIRVGAFALNHVGLFMAFHTIANLIGSPTGHVAMFIVGNAIVLALEGLIVLIQGLRLVYYEMFSKYYEGDGLAFSPMSLKNLEGEKI